MKKVGVCALLLLCVLVIFAGCRKTVQTEPADAALLSGIQFSKVYLNGQDAASSVRYGFIELYNTTENDISLRGASLYHRIRTYGVFAEYSLPDDLTVPAGGTCLLLLADCAADGDYRGAGSYSFAAYDCRLPMPVDDRENTLLLAPCGMTFDGNTQPGALSGIGTWFRGTHEKEAAERLHTACGMSSSVMAVKIENDGGYRAFDLDTAGKAELLAFQPHTAAGEGASAVCPVPVEVTFSQAAGIYKEAFSLTLSAPDGFTILYTTDGSDPSVSDTAVPYTEPIEVLPAEAGGKWGEMISRGIRILGIEATPVSGSLPAMTVIRAYAYRGSEVTGVFTNSYMVSADFTEKYHVKVIEISMKANTFLGSVGFYNHFGESNSKDYNRWRSDGYTEIFDENGTRISRAFTGLAVAGKYSATLAQKSIRFYWKNADNDRPAGENGVFYPLFGNYATSDTDGGALTSFSRLVLRNGGNDLGLSYLRDSLVQRYGSLLGTVSSMAYTPALLFVNGEFWGMYNLRERYTCEYVSAHTGVLKDNAVVIESDYSKVLQDNSAPYVVCDGNENGADDFNEITKFIIENDMSDPGNYAYACEKIDMDSLIGLYTVHLFFGVGDWPYNNVKVWRNENPDDPSGFDTKWHFCLLDMDTGLGLNGDASHDLFSQAFDPAYTRDHRFRDGRLAKVANSLLDSQAFREAFLTSFYRAATEIYTDETLTSLFQEVKDDVSPLMPLQAGRWQGTGASVSRWQKEMQTIETYLGQRRELVLSMMYDYFDTDGDSVRALLK